MQAQGRLEGILCGGSRPSKAAVVCVQEGCGKYAIMCVNEECDCTAGHRGHTMQRFEGLADIIREEPALPESYQKAERVISNFIDGAIRDFEQLRQQHLEHIRQHMAPFKKQERLRLRLLHREPLDRDATGQAICEMLREARAVTSMDNPYLVPAAETERRLQELTRRLEEVKSSAKDLWAKEFRNTVVGVRDIEQLPVYIKAVTFVGCQSKEWQQVGSRLATLPSLASVSLRDCDSTDELCAGLRASRSLKVVAMSTCGLTQRTAESPTREWST
jgi:hypothetical protein